MEAASHLAGPSNRFERLRFARGVLQTEADAITSLGQNLNTAFSDAVERVLACEGALVVSGMGKAGLIGRKLSASFSSTGTPSHFLHPAEAIHGDLGAVRAADIVLALSFSGETEEIVRLAASLQAGDATVLAMTGRPSSTLAKHSDLTLDLGELEEACHLGLAPSTSTTAMLALGDALALTASRERGFERADFARYHPGGSLGRRLAKVDQWMRPLSQCRRANEELTIRQVFSQQSQPGRRSGAILALNADEQLVGVFTDSDLARMLSQKHWEQLDEPMRTVMTTSPKTIQSGELLETAVAILDRFKISELPVIDRDNRPVGLLDITDVVGLSSQTHEASTDTTPPVTISIHAQGKATS